MADGHIHKHLHSMFHLLRSEETLKMAVKLESARMGRTRYLVVVSCSRKMNQRKPSSPQQQQNSNLLTNAQNSFSKNSPSRGNQPTSNSPPSTTQRNNAKNLIMEKDLNNMSAANRSSGINSKLEPQQIDTFDQSEFTDQNNPNDLEESCLLGIDCNENTTIGLCLRILGDTTIRLDGDGGFCINGSGRTHIFKPVSVQAMWSALQTLHKVCAKARENNFYPGGPSHDWASHYDNRVDSEQSCLNEWNAMDSLETKRPPSPDTTRNTPTEREKTEDTIRIALKEIIVQLDLDEVTSKFIRTRLENYLNMNLNEYKSFIDEEMLKILKQMDSPTKIFDHVYLGSEWNASNLEELQILGVRHILNVTREIDNFFPGMFDYFNVRVYDDDKTNLLKHWDNTYKYISQAKKSGSNVLVHCKMGISRSASVVIAYAMKAYGWSFSEALDHVKNNRNCVKPNKNFLNQLETYQGMLMAMRNKEKLQRSKSDTNLRSVKDARLLPGSEPTPLIQAFEAAAKKQNSVLNRTIGSNDRPKSWSPDSVESAVLLPRQHSQSLENLPPESNNLIKSKNNVRLPCENGQHYSVSQNQVFHLEESPQSMYMLSNVKLIVNELESKTMNKEVICDIDMKKSPETSRTNVNNIRVVTKPPISATACDKTAVSVIGSVKLRNDPNRSNYEQELQIDKCSPIMKSKSLEVTNNIITAINMPNDLNIKPPTSNTANRQSVHDDTSIQTAIPMKTSPMWNRRLHNHSTNNISINNNNTTARCGSSSSNSSTSSNVSLSNLSPDLINDLSKSGSTNVKNLRNTYAHRAKSVSSMSQIFDTIRSTDNVPIMEMEKRNKIHDTVAESSIVNMTIARLTDNFPKDIVQRIKKRCKSDGMLYESDLSSIVNKRFSSFSPIEYTKKNSNMQPFIMWNRPSATKSTLPIKGKRLKNRTLCQTVETLKLNFESKVTEPRAPIGIAKEAKRGKSLPSSPIASTSANNKILITNQSMQLKQSFDKGCEEINVKGLVDKYEVTKLRNEHPNSPLNSSTSNKMARFKRHTIHQSPQHNTVQSKPPPIPHGSVVVNPRPSNPILLSNSLRSNNQTFLRLKDQFNATSAYNTM